MASLFSRPDPTNRLKSNDRVLELSLIDDKAPLSSTGIIDRRIFKGDNKLHAVKDDFLLWELKYECGDLPPPLKQKFTSFSKLLELTSEYLAKRNIKITEIKE